MKLVAFVFGDRELDVFFPCIPPVYSPRVFAPCRAAGTRHPRPVRGDLREPARDPSHLWTQNGEGEVRRRRLHHHCRGVHRGERQGHTGSAPWWRGGRKLAKRFRHLRPVWVRDLGVGVSEKGEVKCTDTLRESNSLRVKLFERRYRLLQVKLLGKLLEYCKRVEVVRYNPQICTCASALST